MTLTEEQRLRVERDNAVDDAKNYQEQIEVMHLRRENELRQMNDMGYEIKRLQAIIDTPPEEAEWKSDLEVLDIATQSSTIDIEIAKKWHSSYRKAQNSNLLRKQENELLRASLVEHEEHENQTHVILGAILGTDDTLENVAKRAAARIKELEAENKRALLELQKSKNRNMCEERVKKDMQQAARIKELEAQLTITNVALENATRKPNVVYITGTGELGPDADAKPREGLYGKYRISKADGSPVDPNADYFVLRLDTDPVARRAAREYSYMTVDRKLALELQKRITRYNPKMMDCINLQFFGVEKPRVWQITEGRVGLLRYCLDTLLDAPDIEESPGPRHSIEMLRAMLTEAE